MADDEKRVDLSKVEPLRPPADTEPDERAVDTADRVGVPNAVAMNTTPAVGVSAEKTEEPKTTEDDDLDALRRG
jgi:hypothetical protein